MPLPVPALDDRRYPQIVSELIARVPVHTPEWTQLGQSDPGVTLVQLFAHLTESLLYRTNQMPERNRAKFLDLLGVKLNPAQAAEGLAVIANERGPLKAPLIPADLELAAGAVPFRTLAPVDALPLVALPYIKRPLAETPPALQDYYALLYAAYGEPAPDSLNLYETIAWDWALGPADLAQTVDRSLWIALLARAGDDLEQVRGALGGRSLFLGLAPSMDLVQQVLAPGAKASGAGNSADLLRFELPRVEGPLATISPGARLAPAYRTLEARAAFDLLSERGVVELPLPESAAIDSWRDLDPLEAGVGDLPPMLEDPRLSARVITWLRVRATGAASARLRWAGINAVAVRQQAQVMAERLPDGDGTPGQLRQLGHAPVLAGSVALSSVEGGESRAWDVIDDLLKADPEVAASPSVAPGAAASARLARERRTDVFELDAEAGRVRFGDGLAGRRPPAAARLYASYSYCEGRDGNVPAGVLRGGPLLATGYAATNPIATSGGADAEPLADGERQVRRFLQHRDRLVTAGDFAAIALRTPGVAIGRVEVLPAWRPELSPAGPGAAPGAVTLMAIPASDPAHPSAPRADRAFLGAICAYCDPRRLVTTELVVRGPVWKGVWLSVGIEIDGGHAVAEVIEAVRAQLMAFLSPLPRPGTSAVELLDQPFGPASDAALRGWPLGRTVRSLVLAAEAARVAGVLAVTGVRIAESGRGESEDIAMNGIELPEMLGISVVAGDPLPVDALRGTAPVEQPAQPRLPVPVVAETC